MAVTTVAKTVGTTGVFSTPQLWEDGAPANLTTSNRWTSGSHAGTFTQGETVTGTGITGGKLLDTDNSSYITFGTTTTPAAGITITGSTSGATCVISGSADVGVIWQGQAQNQEFSGAANMLTVTGSTSSSTAYKELTTAAGASFMDNANRLTNALRYDAANGAAITQSAASTVTVSVTEANARVSKLQIGATSGAAGGYALRGDGATQFFDFLIAEGTIVTSSSTGGAATFTSSATVRNSLIVQRASGAGAIVAANNGSPSFYNCTLVAPDDLATAPGRVISSNSGSSGTVTVQNCALFTGDSTKAIKFGGATFNFTTCYSDISGTTGVTQTTYADVFQDVNDATRDFRLKPSAALTDTGTTDATNAASDIVGTTRPQASAYDVGCWELSMPNVPVLDRHYRARRA